MWGRGITPMQKRLAEVNPTLVWGRGYLQVVVCRNYFYPTLCGVGIDETSTGVTVTVSKFQALINDIFSDKDTLERHWKDLHAMNRHIAKRVMGWDYVRNDPEGKTPHAVYMKGGKVVAQHDWSPMTEMSDAWQVWARLAELGYVLMVIWGAPIGHQPLTAIQAVDPGNIEVFNKPLSGDALPAEMICQAALRIIAREQ